MPDLTVSSAVDTLLDADTQADIRSAVGAIRTLSVSFSLPSDGDVSIPFIVPVAGTVIGWSLVTENATGDVELDIWKDTTLPTSADSIVASAPPTGQGVVNSTTMTGWTTSVAANDVFRVECTAASNASTVTLSIKIQES